MALINRSARGYNAAIEPIPTTLNSYLPRTGVMGFGRTVASQRKLITCAAVSDHCDKLHDNVQCVAETSS